MNIPLLLNSLHIFSIFVDSKPIIASIEYAPFGNLCCIKYPLCFNNCIPSSNFNFPLYIRAEYSPKLRPTDISAFILFLIKIDNIAKLIVAIAI